MKLKMGYKNFVKNYPEIYHSAVYYPTFLKLRKKGNSFQTIKNTLYKKVPYSTLHFWFHGRIPLPFKEFSSIKKEFNEKDLENLGTIVGHVLGDGGITRKKILRYCNTEDSLIDEFQNAINDVFHKSPMNKFKEKTGIIRLDYPRLISRALLCLFGEFSLGGGNKKITYQIDRMPVWWKIKLIQAFYNDDGSVPDSGHYMGVTFKQKDKDLTLWVQKILKKLGIISRLTKDENRWHLRITNYLDMVKFREKVNFSKGYRKQVHLDEIIARIKYPHWKTKNQIIELLKKRTKTRKELVSILNLKAGTIYGHLHGWKRKGKIKKTTKGLVDIGMIKVRKKGRINIYELV